jgi:hypothetical protein
MDSTTMSSAAYFGFPMQLMDSTTALAVAYFGNRGKEKE